MLVTTRTVAANCLPCFIFRILRRPQKALGQRLHKAQETVDAASESYQVARNRYEGGLANFLEVLTAQDGMLSSQSARTNLRSQSFTQDIALQRALGGGYQLAQR